MTIIKESSINPAGFGSLTNAISATHKSPEPVVGMGATKLMWTDRVAYTVVEVLSPRRIVVQQDSTDRVNKQDGMTECQEYTYTPDPEAPKLVITLRKNGRWYQVGESIHGSPFALGMRDSYHDFSF